MKTFLRACNKFSQKVECTPTGYESLVSVLNRTMTEILNGFVNERRVISMLEAKEYAKIRHGVALHGGKLSTDYEAFHKAPISSSFVQNVEVMPAIYGYGKRSQWTDVVIQKLRKLIIQFKKAVCECLHGINRRSCELLNGPF